MKIHNIKNYKTQHGIYIDNGGKLRIRLGEIGNYKGAWVSGDDLCENDIVYVNPNSTSRNFYYAINNVVNSTVSPYNDTTNFKLLLGMPIGGDGGSTTISVENSTGDIQHEVILDLSLADNEYVLSAHLKQEISNKLAKTIVMPNVVPQNQLFSANASEQQVMLNIGSGLSIDNGSLVASGGTQLYRHTVTLTGTQYLIDESTTLYIIATTDIPFSTYEIFCNNLDKILRCTGTSNALMYPEIYMMTTVGNDNFPVGISGEQLSDSTLRLTQFYHDFEICTFADTVTEI